MKSKSHKLIICENGSNVLRIHFRSVLLLNIIFCGNRFMLPTHLQVELDLNLNRHEGLNLN